MSLRNKVVRKPLSPSELEALKELNQKKAQFQNSGLSPDQVARAMAAEETVFAIKDTKSTRAGSQVSDNFTKVSDLDPSQGIVIHNPVTHRNDAIIGKDNRLYNPDGSLHPATLRMMKKFGL